MASQAAMWLLYRDPGTGENSLVNINEYGVVQNVVLVTFPIPRDAQGVAVGEYWIPGYPTVAYTDASGAYYQYQYDTSMNPYLFYTGPSNGKVPVAIASFNSFPDPV